MMTQALSKRHGRMDVAVVVVVVVVVVVAAVVVAAVAVAAAVVLVRVQEALGRLSLASHHLQHHLGREHD